MFNDRQRQLLRLVLSYSLSNLPDICDTFSSYEQMDTDEISYNGEVMAVPREDELEEMMKILQ